jgi:hypothetical protein
VRVPACVLHALVPLRTSLEVSAWTRCASCSGRGSSDPRASHRKVAVKLGLFWVHALEYDPVGYFASRASAILYVLSAWDAVEKQTSNRSSLKGKCHVSR